MQISINNNTRRSATSETWSHHDIFIYLYHYWVIGKQVMNQRMDQFVMTILLPKKKFHEGQRKTSPWSFFKIFIRKKLCAARICSIGWTLQLVIVLILKNVFISIFKLFNSYLRLKGRVIVYWINSIGQYCLIWLQHLIFVISVKCCCCYAPCFGDLLAFITYFGLIALKWLKTNLAVESWFH